VTGSLRRPPTTSEWNTFILISNQPAPWTTRTPKLRRLEGWECGHLESDFRLVTVLWLLRLQEAQESVPRLQVYSHRTGQMREATVELLRMRKVGNIGGTR